MGDFNQSYNCSLAGDTAFFMDFNWTNCTNSTSIDTMPFLPAFVRILQATVYFVVMVLGVSLNLFLALLIVFCKSLRQRGFAVAVQILLANIAFIIPILTTSAHTALAGDWTLGDEACQIIAFINQSLQPLRWLLTAVLVIDRALTIKLPLKYEKHGTKVVILLSAIAQLTGLLTGIIPPSLLPICNRHIVGTNTCHFSHTNDERCPIFWFAYFTFIFTIGGVLPFCLYVWMFCRAKKATRRVMPGIIHVGTNKISTISQRVSVSPKQVLTMFILFWTLIGCVVPHYLSLFVTYLAILTRLPVTVILYIAYLIILTQPLYYAVVIADPIALMWHKDVKIELKKLKKRIQTTISTYFVQAQSPATPSSS